jgi:cytochrome P450
MFDVLKGVSHNDLSLEALAQIIAGGDTTASTLTYATIAITGDPKIHQRLVSELEAALNARGRRRGERLPLRELEDIPYLMAVVKESVRCAVAQPARLPRVVPAGAEPLVVDGKVVPPGVSFPQSIHLFPPGVVAFRTVCLTIETPDLQTIVGMSAYSMNMSEEIFGPDAWVFNPERWLQPDSKQLAEQIYTFSKGPRICLGIK